MRPNWYVIITRAVEEGAAAGVRRAFKHTDTPTHDAIVENVEQHVMNAICEVVTFEDHGEE